MISKRKRNTIYVYCMTTMIMLLSLISNITEVTTQLSNSKRVVANNQVVESNEISYGLVAIEASSSIEKSDAKIDTEEKKEEDKSEKTSNKEESNNKKKETKTKKTQTSTKKTAKKTSTVKTSASTAKLPSNKELGKQIAEYAKQFVGNPYKMGGTSLTKGADCSGFTQSVFKHFGISLSRTAASQSTNGVYVPFSKLEPGDLVFYTKGNKVSHVAIYIGNGKIVHAGTPKTGINISKVNIMTKVTARRVVK